MLFARRTRLLPGLVAGFALLVASPVAAGPRNLKEYCISGTSTGATWGWTVENASTFATMATASGLSVTMSKPADDLRDTFVASLEGLEGSAPYIFAQAFTSTTCGSPDAAFRIAAQDDFNLLVTASGSGTPTVVGPPPTGTVNFNPDIYLIPEPTQHAMLLAGVSALAALERRRRR